MLGSVLICAMVAVGAAPVPAVPVNLAPPPRLVKPDVSLIFLEEVWDGGSLRARLVSIGFRNGKALPTEVIREYDKAPEEAGVGGEIRANRYLVSNCGTVLDLREKRILNPERDGEVVRIGDTKVTYWIAGENRERGLFAFEYATEKLTRLEKLKELRIPPGVKRSPDDLKAIDWIDGELFLHRDGPQRKSLGTGFTSDRKLDFGFEATFSAFPVLWLDDNHFLTQRETGKLVTVDLDGKMADVVTIKDFPKSGSIELIRDRTGSIVYSIGEKHFEIDLAKKAATPTDWTGLGYGFEMTWEPGSSGHYQLRHNGKDIGRRDCSPYVALAAPGYLAVPIKDSRTKDAVWCAATGEWTTLESACGRAVVGWIK